MERGTVAPDDTLGGTIGLNGRRSFAELTAVKFAA